MGLQIGNIVARRELTLPELKGKIVAVDAFNALYQFLASIRQPDGTPLMDFKGKTTSHLSGLFYRNMALLQEGIQLIYVFDGEYHPLKDKTHEIRQEARDLAREKYETAAEEGDMEGMGKYGRGLTRLNSEMIAESKELLQAMGIAVVQAPGEGEMQCAELVKSGQAYAVASQDYDAIAVGAPRLIQNLTLSRKRKTTSGFIYIAPELIEYSKVLNELGIDGDQLISLAILVGTDFNPGGIKGLGPKKSLALVIQKKYPVEIFKEVEARLEFNWQEVFEIFKKPNVSKEVAVFPKFDEEKIKEILVKQHDFSAERVESQLVKLRDSRKQLSQSTLF
jgi:flap endonuclease-1